MTYLKKAEEIGIFSKTTDSSIIEAAGIAGLDFIILDQEHGPVDLTTLQHHVRAAKLTAMKPIIRVRSSNPEEIASALDTGASGVQIPNISNSKQAQAAIEAARFYPKGNRGVCRFVRAAEFGNMDKSRYFKESNKSTIILQVEGVEAINNLDSILSLEGIDVLFIGPYDLSQSVGKPGEINSPEVIKLIDQIVSKTQKKGVKLGTFCDTLSNLESLRNKGFEYIAYSVDINIFLERIQEIKGKVK